MLITQVSMSLMGPVDDGGGWQTHYNLKYSWNNKLGKCQTLDRRRSVRNDVSANQLKNIRSPRKTILQELYNH